MSARLRVHAPTHAYIPSEKERERERTRSRARECTGKVYPRRLAAVLT